MAAADRIERERLAKRARILDAARELFIDRGVEAVTLRQIAQRIEYSTTAIYVQFKDKQDLVEQMVREDFAAFAAALAAVANRADPVDRLRALCNAYVEFALTMPRHYQLLFMTPPTHKRGHPPRSPEPRDGIEGYHLLLRTVSEAMQAGRFRQRYTDAAAIAQALWANVHGLVSLLIVTGEVTAFHWRSPAELVDLSMDSIMRALLEPPEPPGPTPPAKRKRRSTR